MTTVKELKHHLTSYGLKKGFPGGDSGKELACPCTAVQSLGHEDPLVKVMATHSSILAWRIAWAEEPGGLQSLGSQRVRHDEATQHACMG